MIHLENKRSAMMDVTNVVNVDKTWLTPLMFFCDRPGSTTWIFQPKCLCVKHWVRKSYTIKFWY